MADQNSPDPLTPVLPPQTSSIDNDMPISEVVAALTEVKTETPPTIPTPVPSTSATPPETPLVKSPLFEDPDQIKVPGVS